ncbi:WW domain binding protein 11-domain-containing protein [Coniochaeta sp. 2T2.1]|nr:WW domain binding protein 11-domain-containing protein [Coniochaeta sp. 2T2.1]
MVKEKKFNPVAAERKAQKQKEIKKGKADLQARRNEKLAQRNPNRLKEQIAALKAITESGGKLTKLEEQSLESLERDLKAILKAREALGDKAPTFGRGGQQGGNNTLGKRRRDDTEDVESDDSDVPEDVKRIPMPRDTPPPIPKAVLDEWWAKRRAKRQKEQDERGGDRREGGGGANALPLGKERGIGGAGRDEKSATPTPVAEPKVVYEAKPIVRDLRKEAVSAFVPTAVRQKMQKTKGVGGLMEPEEADRLEREGYLKTTTTGGTETVDAQRRTVTMEEVEDDED